MFYLVLRGMDTIEDDMTIPIDKKIPLLRTFHEKISQKDWIFTKSNINVYIFFMKKVLYYEADKQIINIKISIDGPNEKDRQLLMEFDVVIEEFLLLPKE
jgi:farnesyl-diphosphate farnesyltransferase